MANRHRYAVEFAVEGRKVVHVVTAACRGNAIAQARGEFDDNDYAAAVLVRCDEATGPEVKRFNTDGRWNLRYLRSQLANAGKVSVYKCGSNWIISKYVDAVGAWVQKPAPYHYDERDALCLALGLDDYPKK